MLRVPSLLWLAAASYAAMSVVIPPISHAQQTRAVDRGSARLAAHAIPMAASSVQAQPIFSLPGGTYASAQTVTITDATPNSSIYYTTDGSIPTASSSKYTSGIAIGSSETLRAIAIGPNQAQSLVTSATYTIASQAGVSIVSTIAGLTWSNYGIGGAATSAYLPFPRGIAVDSAGNFYIAGGNFCQIFKVNAATGVVTLFAGSGQPGISGSGQLAVNAQFYCGGIAIDSSGNLYEADPINSVVWKIDAATGIIAIVAGDGKYGFAGDGEAATKAELAGPVSVAVDGSGNLYIADTNNDIVRKVNAAGIISTFAGTPGKLGSSGNGGAATSAQLGGPEGLAVDKAGNLYIGDVLFSVVREVNAAGIISGFAEVLDPAGLALDATGNLYVSDTNYNLVSKVSGGVVTTIAGNGTSAFAGDGGPAASAEVSFPEGIAVDASGRLYFADNGNNRVRRVDSSGTITTVAGNGEDSPLPDGAVATAAPVAALYAPNPVVVDASGDIVFTDPNNQVVRKISAVDGTISTVAGTGVAGYSGDDGPATSAQLNYPEGLALDQQGNLYIADTNNLVVRKVSASTGDISTYAGNGAYGTGGDGGPATSATLGDLYALAIDGNGDLFLGDAYDCVVRMVTPGGTISTVAGDEENECDGPPSGDGGPATSATLGEEVNALALDAQGNLYIGAGASSVREVNMSTGVINTVAGNGTYGYSGDGKSALDASLGYVYGLAFDAHGDLYVEDDQAIRVVNPAGIISSVAGQGGVGYSGDGGLATSAQISPVGIALDTASNIYFADQTGIRIRKISQAAAVAPQAAQPVLTPVAGAYALTQTISISDSTPGAQIFFTLDGSTPNPGTSPLYSAPLSLVNSVQVSAIAIAPGYSTSGVTAASYTFSPASQTISFTQPGTVTYGAAPIALSATASSGLPVTFSLVSGPGIVKGSSLVITGAGTVVVAADQGGNFDYLSAAEVRRTIVVSPARLVIDVKSASRVYGAANPAFSGAVSGLQNGDKVTVTYSTTATERSAVGVYPITAGISGSAAANYRPQVTNGALTVTKARLTIKVKNATRVYGKANPAFSGTVTGLVNGDRVAVTYGTTATVKSAVGKYSITAKISGAAAGNYAPAVTDGILTVTPAPLAAPVFSPKADHYAKALKVTIADATTGAAIHYTTNGLAPTIKSALYSGPIAVTKTETLKAIATAPNHTQSPIATATYSIP